MELNVMGNELVLHTPYTYMHFLKCEVKIAGYWSMFCLCKFMDWDVTMNMP